MVKKKSITVCRIENISEIRIFIEKERSPSPKSATVCYHFFFLPIIKDSSKTKTATSEQGSDYHGDTIKFWSCISSDNLSSYASTQFNLCELFDMKSVN